MAPRRQPLSLYNRCVLLLSRQLESLSSNQSPHFSPELSVVVRHIRNSLPVPLQAAIGQSILELRESGQHPVTPCQVLVLLNLRSQKLMISGSVVHAGVLENADGSHVESLYLYYGGCGDRTAKIQTFLHSATNLTNLRCSDFCNDKMLEIIANTCPNLHCLALNACDVTNEGVMKLCGLNYDFKQGIKYLSEGVSVSALSACARSLKQIKLIMTKVTEAGVAIILLVLPGIELLRVPDIEMNQLFNFLQAIDHKNIQSSLLEFHSRKVLDEFQLTVLTNLCPNLEYIQVTLVGDAQMDIVRLEKLARLNKLKRAKIGDVHSDALVWFLERVGMKIEQLHLHSCHKKMQISRRHVQSLAKFCPTLLTLTIDGYTLDENDSYINDDIQYFKALKSLVIASMKLSEDDLKVFLSHCQNIKTLDLTLLNPHVLHDKLIIQFLNSGLWKDILKVRILNSPITLKLINKIVDECPLLKELGCLYTWLISKQQLAEFKEQVKNDNLDLEVY